MPVAWAAIGAISGVASAGAGIFGAGKRRLQAQTQGAIGSRQRKITGVREVDAMANNMTLSGVEISDTNVAGGSEDIEYDKGRAGFLGIGRRDGGSIENRIGYDEVTDTAGLIMGNSRDAVRLDASAIKLNAANMASAYTVEGFSAGLTTFARAAIFADTLMNNSGTPGGTPEGKNGFVDKLTYFGSGLYS